MSVICDSCLFVCARVSISLYKRMFVLTDPN